jgi:hypothetical protein
MHTTVNLNKNAQVQTEEIVRVPTLIHNTSSQTEETMETIETSANKQKSL